ncbi:MAG: KAP family P-loop NTPase fold protein [Bacteroidota bacterium]
MRIRSEEIEITPQKPFKNDKLEREENVKILTDVVKTSDESFVLAINSSFGTGKTTFLRMWKAYLESNDIPCLIYNAWENDYSDSPLLTLMAELEKQIRAKELNVSEESEEIFKTAKSIGGTLIKKSIPLSLRLLTGGLLNLKDEDVENTISEIFEITAEKGINNYIDEQDEIENFKNELSDFVQSLTEDNRTRLIIFVDELDRCKPSFAVQLLEDIKHIFEIRNIYFILAVDSDQLNNSLKSIYGKDLDVRGYLKRFIDLEYKLPKADVQEFIPLLVKQLGMDELFNKRHGNFNNDKKHFIKCASALHNRFSVSLRDFEHIFRKILIVLKSSGTNEDIYPHLLLFLIVLRENNPSTYNSFVNQDIKVKEFFDFLKQGINLENLDDESIDDLRIIKAYYLWYTDSNYLDQFYEDENIKADLPPLKEDEVQRLASLQGYLKQRIRTFGDKRSIIDKLSKKINMLQPLNEI